MAASLAAAGALTHPGMRPLSPQRPPPPPWRPHPPGAPNTRGSGGPLPYPGEIGGGVAVLQGSGCLSSPPSRCPPHPRRRPLSPRRPNSPHHGGHGASRPPSPAIAAEPSPVLVALVAVVLAHSRSPPSPTPTSGIDRLSLPLPYVAYVNVGGFENVLKAAKRTPELKKIVYTSSYFAIGPTDGCVANENQIHQGESFCTEYEKSKFLADRIALQAAAEGVPITIVYPGVMYGPGTLTSGNLVCRVLIERFNGRLPGYIGHGYDRGSFSHVDDVVKGHIAAMEKGRVGERYLLTGENASFVQIFNLAANLTNTKPPRFHIPLWLLAIYGWISVCVARITGKPPLISYPGVECLRHQWAYSCDKAKRELGYSPRSLTEGLAETLLYLKNENLIKF